MMCTEAFLRHPARLGRLGVPIVKVVSPVVYLSFLSATCRSVVDSLSATRKLRLHESPGEDIVSALSIVRDLAKCDAGSSPSTLSPSSSPLPRPHSWSLFRRITISCCLALSTAFVKGSCTLERKLSLEQLTDKVKSPYDKGVSCLMAMPKGVRISLSSSHRLHIVLPGVSPGFAGRG